ncbi:universal stress protein UspA-like protein [Candidatus Nitrososphaera evergladensis SR1]|uniref:Universal stress protein UspA-like protein n=1 Tax=Candidatus Nitrososphaera evergladensis SR1 TaxID=1459636 RepID=A0A075MTJ0_9ARCH|nr:universal stress protein [Candidatus Nitrososphaera evergladensis]AIF82609.1 universal stress protein UspA-like protein [Candidatus Nitrososphaera evergladensis SR1]
MTKEFEKILVAVDGSDQSMRAVDIAISLAKKYESALTALYVIHIPFGESLYPRSAWHKDFIDDINKDTGGWFAEIQRRGKENGVEISSEMKETAESVPAEITRYAKEDKIDLIVVGSKGKSELEKMFLGSVAAGVLAYAPCPVLVVR